MDAVPVNLTREALLKELESSKMIIKALESALSESENVLSKAKEAELVIEHLREKLSDKDVKEHVMCHDIRNCMSPLVQVPEVIIEEANLSEDQVELLMALKIRAQRALRILDIHMLNLNTSRVDLNFEQGEFNMHDIVADVISNLEATAKLKNVSIRTVCQTHSSAEKCNLPVICNCDVMFSILSNIILNSIEAAPQYTDVVVRLVANDKQEVFVTNVGEVPEAIRCAFFEKYITSDKVNGTGIGTYSARLFTEAQNGKIILDTSKSGSTTVILRFPRPSAE
jgi:signal transduction histidine kinase